MIKARLEAAFSPYLAHVDIGVHQCVVQHLARVVQLVSAGSQDTTHMRASICTLTRHSHSEHFRRGTEYICDCIIITMQHFCYLACTLLGPSPDCFAWRICFKTLSAAALMNMMPEQASEQVILSLVVKWLNMLAHQPGGGRLESLDSPEILRQKPKQ